MATILYLDMLTRTYSRRFPAHTLESVVQESRRVGKSPKDVYCAYQELQQKTGAGNVSIVELRKRMLT